MNGPTKPLQIEGYTISIPESIKQENQRAYAAYFLHTFLGTTEMTKHAPKLHNEFYGPNRNAVKTQRIWRNVGHQAHEDAQLLIEQSTNNTHYTPIRKSTNPTDLIGLMSAIEDNPGFVAAFERTRKATA